MSETEEPPEVRVRLLLKIETTYEISGDYMRGSTLPELLKWAKDDARFFNLYIQRGQNEHKQVPAKISVQSVTIEPRA